MNKSWKTLFFFFFFNCLGQGNSFLSGHVPGSGRAGRFAPGVLEVSGFGRGLGAWVSRCSRDSQATLGVSSFSGVGKFCFGS